MKFLRTTVFIFSIFSFSMFFNAFSMIEDSDMINERRVFVESNEGFVSDEGVIGPIQLVEDSDDDQESRDVSYDEEAYNQLIAYSENRKRKRTFRGANFNGVELENKDIRGAILDDSTFVKSSLTNINLDRTSLKKVDFSDSTIVDIIFNGLDLSHVNFEQSDLNNVRFKEIKKYIKRRDVQGIIESPVSGISFKGASFKKIIFGSSFLKKINFSSLDIDFAKFNNLILEGCNFSKSDINNAFFINTQIINSSFQGVNITSSKFYKTKFNNVSFKDSKIVSLNSPIVFEKCDFTNVDFDGTSLVNIVFDHCRFVTKGENACKNIDYIAFANSIVFNSCWYGDGDSGFIDSKFQEEFLVYNGIRFTSKGFRKLNNIIGTIRTDFDGMLLNQLGVAVSSGIRFGVERRIMGNRYSNRR